MCGIVGYVGPRAAQALLLEGLRKLEYRGYDSAGVSLIAGGEIASVRAVGNLDHLVEAVHRAQRDGGAAGVATREPTTGIGHTRWATHGRVNESNAHPHFDTTNRVHVVVNGIVENYLVLKRRLEAEGAAFTSETDAEVIAHLVSHHLRRTGSLPDAVRAAFAELEGHYAFVAMALDEPELLVGARQECPLVVGRGDGETFLASAIPAFLRHTRRVQFIENGELVAITPEGATFLTPDGGIVEREVVTVDWDEDTAEKGGYETFMLKEIHEQADAVAETIADRTIREDGVDLAEEAAFDEALLHGVDRIVVVACGTSYHAGLIGRYAIEEWARVPVEMDVASEYRYRNPVVGPRDLVIGITQSGETADTLAAMRLARERGARVLAVTNVMGSQATREADGVLYTRAGLEIGVAATKTFVCQVAVMYLLGLRLAELRGTLGLEDRCRLVAELKRVPHEIAEPLAGLDVDAIAERHAAQGFFLYLGRHVGLPVALEGALKLKEISYIPTDAYAAGEMKHGPIALLDESTPVVVVVTDSPVRDKVVSNIQEVRARGAHVIAVASEGDVEIDQHAEEVIRVPALDWMLQPLLAVIPLQAVHRRRARLRRRARAARPAPRRPLLRQGGGRQGAGARRVVLAGHRGRQRRRRAARGAARGPRRARGGGRGVADAHRHDGGRGRGGPVTSILDPLPTAEEMRATDRWAIEERGIPGIELMERAGAGLARVVAEVAPEGLVVVVCGGGNNGGDGYVAARLLRAAGREVDVLWTKDPAELQGDARTMAQRLAGDAPRPFGGALPAGAAVVVDALLGTGFSGAPRGPVAEAIAAINAAGVPAVAVDVPSGVDATTGEVAGGAVRAVATATFAAAKPGLWIHPGKEHAGAVEVVDIGIPEGAPVRPGHGLITTRALGAYPHRGPASTKFESGHVLVAGGSRGLTGAVCLAAMAAMRAGAGYVTACVPPELNDVFEVKLTEVMTRDLEAVLEATERGGALVLGPGMGREEERQAFARDVARRAAVPLVLDADGLNAHAGHLEDLAQRTAPTVLTPHGGELARLLDTDSDAVRARRLHHAREAARRSGAIVVLKGDDTLVCEPGGRVGISRGDAPALATAGTGDVLSGVLGALLAKDLAPFDAACAAVALHAEAGRRAAVVLDGPDGVIASDVIDELPGALAG
ncbi:MAG: glutamine--fructose-6-phosphate transaminase (isomerizing) [Solirubrobacterales bacterium]|nr:glutamine--fructose-6-phosphate transaminase (isomerizing) [Solirubrobacterales bacterium]